MSGRLEESESNMSKSRFIAIDEQGNYYMIGNNPPRKWLLDYFGRQHADKMYIDTGKGHKHIGYIIAQHWITIYRISPWK